MKTKLSLLHNLTMAFFFLVAIGASITGAFMLARFLGWFVVFAWALSFAIAARSCAKDEENK